MRQRRIYPYCFAGNFQLEAVGELDEDNARVVGKGQQDLSEVLGLHRRLGLQVDHVGNLGEAVDDLGVRFAKLPGNVFKGELGVLHHIVQQGANRARHAEADLLGGDLGHRQGVKDVWLAALPPHVFVRIGGDLEGFAQHIPVAFLDAVLQGAQKGAVMPQDDPLLLLFSGNDLFFGSLHRAGIMCSFCNLNSGRAGREPDVSAGPAGLSLRYSNLGKRSQTTRY